MEKRPTEEVTRARRMTFTFDTGMLVALERRKARATQAFRAIISRGLLPIVPTVVYVEWWRGEAMCAKSFWLRLSSRTCPGRSAARPGKHSGSSKDLPWPTRSSWHPRPSGGAGVVHTADVRDLSRLQRHFPTVTVLPV